MKIYTWSLKIKIRILSYYYYADADKNMINYIMYYTENDGIVIKT